MRGTLLKRILFAVISFQMILTFMPGSIPDVSAEDNTIYLNEDCSSISKWKNTGNASIMEDDTTPYIRYQSDESTPTVATRDLDIKMVDTEIYTVEFDVRFADANSGVVELYGGSRLGPTITFDGLEIKTKNGNPNAYITLYNGAEANKWYNLKFIANSKNSMFAYTTDIENKSTQLTTSSILRNLTQSVLTKINLTNKINSENNIRSGAVDIKNLKVYKAVPNNLKLSQENCEISIPQTDTASKALFGIKSASFGDIDMTEYDLLNQGVVCFKLYDEKNQTEVTPIGITLNKTTGVLSVDRTASEGTYMLRLTSYDDSAYDSTQIKIVPMGAPEKIELSTAPKKIPVPIAGETKTYFSATVTDKFGSEMDGISLTWSITDINGNAIKDNNITIDSKSGVVTAKPGAQPENVLIKVETDGVYAVSDPIEVYNMTPTMISIKGDSYFSVSSKSKTYIANIFDQYGIEMPEDTEKIWAISQSNVSINNGVLTVPSETEDMEVTISVISGTAEATKKINIYNPNISKIEINGDYSIEIPKKGTKKFEYTAKTLDQYGFEITGITPEWDMLSEDNTSLSFSGSTITVGTDVKEQTIILTASSDGIDGEIKIVVTENPFNYKPVDGGFEIDNGNSNDYVRPIYPPHINDDLLGQNNGTGKPNVRFIYYLGDKPKLALTSVGPNVNTYKRYAHMFIGIKNGKWLDEMENITSRYVYGHEEYVITDSSFDGEIKLTYTRSNDLDAMIIKAEVPDSIKDKLVIATAGQGGAEGSQPTGGNSSKLKFVASDSTPSEVDGNVYHISGGAEVSSITGTASIPMNYAVKDATSYMTGDVNALLNSSNSKNSMVVGTTENNTDNEIYCLLTTETSDSEYIENFAEYAKTIFDNGIKYYREVSEKVKIDTPDPYINSAITVQTMATDASWDSPVITHGPMGWHVAFGGWRGGYGFVDAGWGERIKSNATEFKKTQKADGRIQAYANKDDRYNMGVVLVDALLQYWDWSGDDEFFRETGYDFVAGHLKFMDKEMQVPGTNLYENWLDAWNTDNKWNNGAAGSIATAYTWRAYNTMAKIATKLGKADDAKSYQEKADAIIADMNEKLWDKDTGVFGEYRERFGQDRINTAPDLSSVYTPIDMGIATPEQEYQMLRFTDYAIPSLEKPSGFPSEFWNTIEFKYSSNRPPEFYSSDGLYIQEVMNNALAYYENGQRDMAMKQFRACLVPLMKGRNAAGQGVAGHQVRASLENNGHIDFADTSTQYVRTAVEGLFGIKMNIPNEIADITPGFPEDWKHASIKTNYLSYDFKNADKTDVFNVYSEKSLSYVMHIPVRSSKIESVKINDILIDTENYTVDNFVNIKTPIGKNAKIEIKYTNKETAKVESAEVGGTNSEYQIASNGTITSISDPQGILAEIPILNKNNITVKLANKQGNHTFFVTVEKDDMKAVIPVDLVIKESVEITDMSIVSGNTAGIELKLTNNTEKPVTLNAIFSSISGSITKNAMTIPAKSTSTEIIVPVEKESDLTPGNNKVTCVLSGDVEGIISGEVVDWQLEKTITNNQEQYQTISLNSVVNQDLRTLHSNTYDLTYEGNDHYRLPNFYWSNKNNTTRTVLENGRSWWEHSANAVPVTLNLPASGGGYTTEIGVPFNISSQNGKNSAFVSLYNQFPNKINIPIGIDGSKIYFMLSVSTNNMQSRIENARITVNFADGTNEILPLTNPNNIDDWLNYQQSSSYAESGYIQALGNGAHSNIVAIDFGRVKQIENIDFECLSSEVLAGLLGITVVGGEYTEPLNIGEIKFDKHTINTGDTITASADVTNNSLSDVTLNMMVALYNKNGVLKELKTEKQTIKSAAYTKCHIMYELSKCEEGDYVKAFLWNGLDNIKSFTAAKTLGK